MTQCFSTFGRRVARIVSVGPMLCASACDSPTAPTGPDTTVVDEFRVDGIVFTASATALDHGAIEVTLTAMNETDFFAQTGILGGNCMLRPRVYTDRGGRLVWSAFDLFDGCQEPLRLFQLDGGAEDRETRRFEAQLGDGDYFVTLTIDALVQVEIAAGAISFR